MVLDTRFPSDKDPVTAGTPKTVTGSTSGRTDGAPQAWAELLQEALQTPQAERFAEVVQRLRQMLPGDGGIAALWAMLGDVADGRRRLAALVLGYHRAWLASRSRLRGMVALATSEADPQVARAMVWTLRQQDEVAPFLAHRDEGVAREAALGVPLNRHCVAAVVRALLLDLHPQLGGL